MAEVKFNRYANETTYKTQESAGTIEDGTLFVIKDTQKVGIKFGTTTLMIGIKDLQNAINSLRSDFEGQNSKLETRLKGN